MNRKFCLCSSIEAHLYVFCLIALATFDRLITTKRPHCDSFTKSVKRSNAESLHCYAAASALVICLICVLTLYRALFFGTLCCNASSVRLRLCCCTRRVDARITRRITQTAIGRLTVETCFRCRVEAPAQAQSQSSRIGPGCKGFCQSGVDARSLSLWCNFERE